MLGFIVKKSLSTVFPITANNLADNKGARYKFKRLGRGRASGKGKTSGRGHKGTKARSGGSVHPRFEGGQTPLSKRLPKWGMSRKAFVDPLNTVNFAKLYYFIQKGRLDTTKTITINSMFEAGVFSDVKYGVKLLAKGVELIDRPLNIEITEASMSAIKAVNEKGGSVVLKYRTPKQIQYHLKPYKFPLLS